MLAFTFAFAASAAESIDFYANGMLKDFFDADGDDDAAEGYLKNAGRGELDWIDGALWFVDRPHSYSGLDVLFGNIPDGEYTLEVKVKSDQPMTNGFTINANATGWGTVLSEGVGATSATLTLELTIEGGRAIGVTNTRGNPADIAFVRIQTRGEIADGDDNVEEDQPDFGITGLRLIAAGDNGGNGGNGDNGGNGGGNGANGVDGDKKPVDTGIGDVAVASAIALVAVGAVVFSRKRK
jgi:hypothetical protein